MQKEEFDIGCEFYCGGRRWRCTDIGTRVVIAICLEPHVVTRLDMDDSRPSKRKLSKALSDDPDWLTGPPYKVAECVFDEYDLAACTRSKDNADGIPGCG